MLETNILASDLRTIVLSVVRSALQHEISSVGMA